jgi:hypothetical protein
VQLKAFTMFLRDIERFQEINALVESNLILTEIHAHQLDGFFIS